jgi:photosystem II stability/assembly factor-like uncharacterized protein
MAPGHPRRFYAGTSSGHIFVSDDGARTWRDCGVRLSSDAYLHRLAVDARSPDTAYAVYWHSGGGGGLIKTRDGGANWQNLSPPGSPPLRAVALSPSSPDTLYTGGPGGIWRSADGGKSWGDAGGTSRRVREIESLVVDPRSPLRVYAGTWRQPYRSFDGGTSWSLIGQGMDLDRDVFTIAMNPADPDNLFAGTCGWLYVSRDGGTSWSPRNKGIPPDQRRVHTIVVDPDQPNKVWAGTRGGIYRSGDGGNSFGLAFGGVSVSGIAADTTGAQIFAGTEELGVLTGSEGQGFRESNTGLNAARIAAFDAMPGDLRVLFAARTEKPGTQSIQMSADAGRVWTQLAPGKRFEKVRFLRALQAPEPLLLVIGEDGRWWKVTMSGQSEAVAPPPGRLAAVEVAHGAGVVVGATDAGLFAVPAGGLPPARPAAAKGDPSGWKQMAAGSFGALAVGGDCYLALGPGQAARGCLSATAADGRAEQLFPEGLPAAVIGAALGPDPGGDAYAFTHDRVLVSPDRGTTWSIVELPWPAKDLRALAFDPGKPGRVVALDSYGVLLLGQERGRQWHALGNDPWLNPAQDFRMSAAAPNLALVATLGHGLRVVSIH